MRINSLFVLIAAAVFMVPAAYCGNFDRGERRIKISGTKEHVSQAEIVIAEKTPILTFAAEELQRFLKAASGIDAEIVSEPSADKISLILGDNKFSREAGLDVKKLASEGFFIKRKGSNVYLAGVDSKISDPRRNPWKMWMRRGTLSAVYDFLERFAGVRFYFAGKYGTIVPENKKIMLPAEIDIIDRPDLIDRANYSGLKSKWYEKNDTYVSGIKGNNLNFIRQRYAERHIPFGHGLDYIDLVKRFGKSHPEYFALTTDGRRYKEADHIFPGQICFSSGVVEEIYQDVKAFFTGAAPSTRGISSNSWSVNFGSAPYVSVMPVDWLYWCCCAKCAKIAKGARVYQTSPADAQAISNAVWKYTADIAKRLKKENINGIVTQMAYGALKRPPECEIPDNVSVQLAVNGMGAPAYLDTDIELLKKWTKRFNSKIAVWTYPGKHMSKAELKGIPAMMHRETGKYLQHIRDYIYGCFLESETDFEIFHYLNYYTFAKVSWNLDTDIDKLLDEHYKLMFGAGAPWMKKFFDELEDLWCKKVTGTIVDSPLGPQVKLPSDFELWKKIYSPAKLKELNSFIDDAKKAAAADKGACERLEFMRRELLGPLMAVAEKFAKNAEILGDWEFHISQPVGLRPYQSEVGDVATKVTVKETKDYFVFIFQCEEPFVKDVKAQCKENDKIDVFTDSCVEVLLNPSGDRKNYYHIGVNLNGAISDLVYVNGGKGDYSWSADCKPIIQKNAKEVWINLSIPKRVFGEIKPEGFPVNFARHRVILGDNAKKVKESNYQWSPVAGRSFHSIEQWGVMNTVKKENKNLLKDGGFDTGNVWLPNTVGKWYVWTSNQKALTAIKNSVLDKNIFMDGFRALCLTNWNKHNIAASQKIKGLKPNTKYRLSYFLRTKGIKNGANAGAGAFFNCGGRQYAFPEIRVTGDTDWHRMVFEFKTASDVTASTEAALSLWIWGVEGKAWFDSVSLTEVK
ncbi:MAG: DUF4838 domain-containing protein [Lentisphaeria bacterium]|nr:DUF4838 domain-containing protein [Lentisphaeria bacterium]